MGGAMGQLRQELDNALAALGITSSQCNMLIALAEEPGISGADLARKCRVTPQTIHKMLVAAEKEGWLKREKRPTNDKAIYTNLSREGVRLLNRARPTRLEVVKTMLKNFSASEIQIFEDFIQRCSKNLSGISN